MSRNKNRVTNYAAPGAHVGLQADDVVITGGLVINMPGGRGRSAGIGGHDNAQAQHGTASYAGDVIAVQAGQVLGQDDD